MSNFLQIPDLNLSHQGKVRDIFEIKNQKYLLIYTSDRISAFDFVFDDEMRDMVVLFLLEKRIFCC